MIKKFAFIVVFSIIGSVLTFASDDKLSYQELKSTGVTAISSPKDSNWHEEQKINLMLIYQKLQELDPESKRNVATFRIKILKGTEILGNQDSNNTFFISGGDLNLLKKLEEPKNFGGKFNFNCISNYCPSEPDKPSDFSLRKNIVEFFDFKEKLKSTQKDDLKKVFTLSLEKQDLFKEITFTKLAIAGIANIYSSTLEMRFFESESTESAKKHELINKIASDDKFEHIDELFGSHFQLNFGDSEQTIRLFINSKNQNNPNVTISEFNKILSTLVIDLSKNEELTNNIKEFDTQDKFSKKKFKNKSKNKSEKDQARETHNEQVQKSKEKCIELNKTINSNILDSIKNIFIEVDIASYYDMCTLLTLKC